MFENKKIKKFLESLKELEKTNIWIERPRQTWDREQKSGLLYYKTITDKNLKDNLEELSSHFNSHINKEVVKQYLIMLQRLYLCDNLDKTTDDYKEALATAGITKSKLDFLDKWAPKKVEVEYENINSSLRKQYAGKITKLLDDEYLREFKDYFNKNKTIFDNVIKYSAKSYEKVFKEEYNKMQDNDKSLVVTKMSVIISVAMEIGQSNYQKAGETLSEWIMEAQKNIK